MTMSPTASRTVWSAGTRYLTPALAGAVMVGRRDTTSTPFTLAEWYCPTLHCRVYPWLLVWTAGTVKQER